MTAQPIRKQPAWLPFAVVGGAVAIVMILWAALSSPGNAPTRSETPRETFTLTGKIVVPMRVGTFIPDGGCIGDQGYSDIQPGARVTAYSTSGSVLATGELQAGRPDSTRCAYTFSISKVVRGEGSYWIEVGGRGKVSFDETTLISSGASLTLG